MNLKLSFLAPKMLLLLFAVTAWGQVEVDVNLNIKHSVDGVSDFGRERHIISHTGPTDPDWSGHEEMMDYFFNDLDVYMGRDNGSAGWKCAMTTEDPEKPHWPDVNSIESVGNGLKNWYESDDHIDRHQYEDRLGSMIMGTNPYPVYPSLDWGDDGKMYRGWQTYDVDAAAFFNAQYLDKHYAKTPDDIGEPLPTYWECINEPDMAILKPFVMFLSSPEKLFEYHNLSAQVIRNTLGGHAPKIGGFTWGQHDFWATDWINRADAEASYYNYSDPSIYPVYDNMWLAGNPESMRSAGSPIYSQRNNSWWQWDGLFQSFIDECGENMDFYSIHIYDWPDTDNGGTIRTGGHTEAMLDMVEWYDMYKFNERKDIIISEYGSVHGGYITSLGYKRRDWENLRPFNQMFMQFLERPSHLVLTMPFAPIKATWGDEWIYDTDPPTLHQRYEVTMMDPIGTYNYHGNDHEEWEWSDIIKWYELWQDVNGTRIDTKSSDRDIQVDAYVNGNHVYLILNNLELDPTDINLNLFDDYANDIVRVKMTHQYLNESINRTVNEVKQLQAAPGSVTLEMSSTMILDYEFANPVQIDQESKEYKYMSERLTTATNAFGSQLCYITANAGTEYTAHVNGVSVPAIGEATLRIGMRVWNGVKANIVVNNQTIVVGDHNSEFLDLRGRELSRGGNGYWGVIEVDIPMANLQANNEVKVMCPHSNMEISSVQIQTWDFTKAPGRSVTGTGNVGVNSIALAGENSVMQGQELALKVNFSPLNATSKAITWISSNPSVATVDEFGVVTAVAASGSTTITATSVDNGTAVATKTISAIPYVPPTLTGIAIQEGNSITVEYFVNTPLTAVITPADAATQNVTWTSSNPDVVEVLPESNKIVGKVVNESATVTASITDATTGQTYTDAIDVYVGIVGEESVFNRQLPDEIRPYPEAELLVDIRTMGARRLEVEISNGSVIGSGSLNFEYYGDTTLSVPYSLLVSNPAIYTHYDVSFKLYNGSTLLDQNTASVYMIDHIHAESVAIVEGMRRVQIGTTLQLEAQVSPEDTYNQNVSWQSSNPSVVSIDAITGLLTGRAAGSTVITVTAEDGGVSDQVTIVSQTGEVEYHIKEISLADTIYVFPGRSVNAAYSYIPTYATETNIAWSSANSAIASVDANGVITASNALDETLVTATASDTTGISTTARVIVTQTIFVEAETMATTGGEYDGFTIGDFGINNNQLGDWGEWEVDVPVSGDYSVRYYMGSPEGNTGIAVNIYVDGVLKQTTDLAATSGWDDYQPFDAASNIALSAGINTIRIESAGTADWQWNMDRFELTLQGSLPCEPLSGITSDATAEVGINGQLTLYFATTPACQKQQSAFTWISSNSNIATVSQSGVVSGVAAGQANITVQSGSIISTTLVTVSEVPPTNVTVVPGSANVAAGSNLQLSAVVEPDYASNKSVTWSSNNPNVTVDQNGVVSGSIIGATATITATSVANTNIAGSATITIVEAPTELVIEAESFVADGGTLDDSSWGGSGTGVNNAGTYIDWVNNEDWVEYTLNVTTAGTYTITYHISSPSDNAQIQFALNGSVISTDDVVNNGSWSDFIELEAAHTVALSTGTQTVRITATGSNTWQWNLDKVVLAATDVPCEVSSVSINQQDMNLDEGQSTTLIATVTANGACDAISWTTGNASIATVSASGTVQALTAGQVTITATSVTTPSQSDAIVITVLDVCDPVSTVSVQAPVSTLTMGDCTTLSATVSPASACEQTVTYSSSNANIASVDANGQVCAVAAGSVTITATAGGVSAQLSLTVNNIPTDEFTLGNTAESRSQGDGWSSNMVINETDIYVNTSRATQEITVEQFSFYARQLADPLTPFVVKVNSANNFTVLAVGTTRTNSDYQVGANTFAFADGAAKVISVAAGETIATGFIDAYADGSGGGSGSVIPFNSVSPIDALWYSGGGSASNAGSVAEGSAPTEGSFTLDLSRNYSYNISFSLGGTIHIPVEAVTLTPATLSMNLGDSYTLSATVAPDNASNPAVSWSSDNAAVSVTNNGVISALAEGSANVTVTTAEGGYSATCAVTVESIPVLLTIEAEDFTTTGGTLDDSQWGGPGLGANRTANNINWVNGDDWMDYDVTIPQDGAYEVVYYTSSPIDGSTISMSIDGTLMNTTTVPNNGGWDNYEALTLSETINFMAGDRVVRLTAGAQTWTWNLDKFTLERMGALKDAYELDAVSSELSLYPNPASDQINLMLSGTLQESAMVMVYNQTGHVVKSMPLENHMLQLSTSELHNGLYVVRVINGNELITERFIKN